MGCIFVAMPGHGQRSSISKFRNNYKTLFVYRCEESGEGEEIFNVLWYQDSVCLYLRDNFSLEKETIYYDSYTRKRKIISGEVGNKEITEYYINRLLGSWVSSLDTMIIKKNYIEIRNGKKEIVDWDFMSTSSSYVIDSEMMIFCRPSHGYRKIISLGLDRFEVLIFNWNNNKKRKITYKKMN